MWIHLLDNDSSYFHSFFPFFSCLPHLFLTLFTILKSHIFMLSILSTTFFFLSSSSHCCYYVRIQANGEECIVLKILNSFAINCNITCWCIRRLYNIYSKHCDEQTTHAMQSSAFSVLKNKYFRKKSCFTKIDILCFL